MELERRGRVIAVGFGPTGDAGRSLLVQRKAAAFVRWHEPYDARVSRTDVCPAKAGMFSRSQSYRGNSQKPRSLDSRVAGNQDPEAYRQGLPWGDYEPPGRNDSERKCGLESEKIRRPSPHPWGEGSMTNRNLTDAVPLLRRGGSDSTVARTCWKLEKPSSSRCENIGAR